MRQVFVLAVLVTAYYIAGKLGLELAFFHPSATAVWPPTGLTVAAFLLVGYWIWPGIALGAFLVNFTTYGSVATSLGIATGNTLEGLLGSFLTNRLAHGRQVFERPQDVFKFTLLVAMLSTTVSAICGVTSLSLAGYADWASYGAIWLTWWLGDAAGALIVTPPVVLWTMDHKIYWRGRQAAEVILLVVVVVLGGLLIFGGILLMPPHNYPLTFLVLPILVWAAVRLGPRETATAIALLSSIALWGTLQSFGPFARGSPNEALLLLQSFMAVIAVTTLTLAASISEQKGVEQTLDQLSQSLERRVEERTLALRQANEQLQELDRLKSMFVSVVSHELRTPLTSIMAYVENMLQGLVGPLNEKQGYYLTRIKHNAERLTRMLTELLDLSRIETGAVELRWTSFLVEQFLKDIVDEFRQQARNRMLVLEERYGHQDLWVVGDPDKLHQVLTNLLQNAIEFTPPGGRVRVESKRLENRSIQISVSDTGCGIPPDELPRVFDTFYRGRSESSERRGAGLGLAIAKNLVELHGGTIRVESAPEQGSSFSIILPHRGEQPCGGDARPDN